MKAIFVVSVELPTPEDAVTVMEYLKPPEIPFFSGEVRIAIDQVAQHVEDWLDKE